MRRTRTLVAVGLALLALGATALPAQAGQQFDIDRQAVCNTDTGEYDVTITITALSLGGSITVTDFQVDGDDTPPPDFVPDPIPNEGTSVATFSIPGDSTSYFLDAVITGEQFETEFSIESVLEGDCESIPTTTTTTPSTTVPTTTTARPAVAVAARPAFTG